MTHDDTPRNVAPADVQIPPIPLLSGSTIPSETGDTTPIVTVTMRITGEDGTTYDVALEQRFGGWWAPAGTTLG